MPCAFEAPDEKANAPAPRLGLLVEIEGAGTESAVDKLSVAWSVVVTDGCELSAVPLMKRPVFDDSVTPKEKPTELPFVNASFGGLGVSRLNEKGFTSWEEV